MLPNRRSEYLELRPAAYPLLDFLAQRIRSLDPELIVQPSDGSPWTAYYHGDKLIALARPATASTGATGSAGAIDVALRPVQKAGTIVDARALDDPEFAAALARAVELAPTWTDDEGVWFGGYGGGAIGALLFVADVVTAVASETARRRANPALTTASDPDASRAILEAARREASRRSHSLLLGCFGATMTGFGLVFVALGIAIVLQLAGAPDWVTLLLLLLIPLGAWLAFRWVRRRYPQAPQGAIARLGCRLLAFAGVAVVALFVAMMIASVVAPAAVTDEQAAWCLGPGSGYVDNAVDVLSLERTWTDETAADDPNFRRACSLAWDATRHP